MDPPTLLQVEIPVSDIHETGDAVHAMKAKLSNLVLQSKSDLAALEVSMSSRLST